MNICLYTDMSQSSISINPCLSMLVWGQAFKTVDMEVSLCLNQTGFTLGIFNIQPEYALLTIWTGECFSTYQSVLDCTLSMHSPFYKHGRCFAS